MGWRGRAVVLLLLQLAFAGRVLAEDNEFAFVFQCDSRKNTVCMTMKYPSGQKMFLLGSKSDVCAAETRGTFNFQRGTREKEISKIEVTRCPNRSSYFLAYVGKEVTGFRRYAPAPVVDPAVVARVDTAIKSLKFYSTANEYFGNTLSARPACFYPIPGNTSLIIAQYATAKPKDNSDKYGPVYLFLDGEVREMASEASVGYLFRMGDRFYMTYRAGCWQGCGILAEVLIEITAEGFHKILIDNFFGA
jgi:hypothetical protein